MLIDMLCMKCDDEGGRDYRDSIIKALLKCMLVTTEYEGHSGTGTAEKVNSRVL